MKSNSSKKIKPYDEKTYSQRIGILFRALREYYGWTQDHVAWVFGGLIENEQFSQSTLQRIESGLSHTGLSRIIILSEVYKADPQKIVALTFDLNVPLKSVSLDRELIRSLLLPNAYDDNEPDYSDLLHESNPVYGLGSPAARRIVMLTFPPTATTSLQNILPGIFPEQM